MSQRLRELDSLRGLAALSVVIHHFLLIFPVIAEDTSKQTNILNILKYSPLHILFAGHEAVILFFILSGFVLSLPTFINKRSGYLEFIVKRICRIYIPYAVIISVAILCAIVTISTPLHNLSDFAVYRWRVSITPELVFQHFFLIRSFNNLQIDPVIWSLVHEMRISLVFPVLVILVSRLRWFTSVTLAYVFYHLASTYIQQFQFQNDYLQTLQYIGMFILGAVIARYRTAIKNIFTSLPKLVRYTALPIAACLYTYSWLWISNQSIHSDEINTLMITAGAALFIILALSSDVFSKILLKRPLTYLGDISYSLYLIHVVVLFLMLNLFYLRMPLAVVLAAALALSLLTAHISYKYVEMPSIKLGKYLSRRITKPVTLAKAALSLEKERVLEEV